MNAQSAPERFLEALTDRDFIRLAGSLAPEVNMRLLLPRGPEQRSGQSEVAARLEGWFATAPRFEVGSTDHAIIGSRHRLSWRFQLVRQGDGSGGPWEVIEQVAFCDEGPEGIERLDLLCSGFHAEAERSSGPVHVLDAGDMGCAVGLADEFRRRVAGIPAGDSLAVIVRDPAAKEDLPALARLLGHSVTSVQGHGDGHVTFSVERRA
jgi:TusA-related sulfurtransferase